MQSETTQSSVLRESKPQGRGMDLEPVSCSGTIMLCEDLGGKGGPQLPVYKGSPSLLQWSLRQMFTLYPSEGQRERWLRQMLALCPAESREMAKAMVCTVSQ